MFFFFFKQKTAYEMRISDWSSDVCSSDLEHLALQPDCARLARPFAARPDSAQWHRIETLAHWLREVTAANARDPLVIRIVELLLLAVVASPEVEAADAGEDTAYVERLLPAVEYLRRDPGAPVALGDAAARSARRRVGNEWVGTF